MTVPELIAALQPFTDVVFGEARVPSVQTRHRQYTVIGVRPDDEGDPVIEVVFNDDPVGEAAP